MLRFTSASLTVHSAAHTVALLRHPVMLATLSSATSALPAETEVVGPSTTERRIGRTDVPALWNQGISLAGTSSAAGAFNFVRWSPTFAQVLVTLAGQGRVWSDNRWLTVGPGTAYITPPGKFHSYHTAPSIACWEVGWVVVPQQSPVPFPSPACPNPASYRATPVVFGAALVGLIHETRDRSDPAMLDSWTRLVRGLASRVAGVAPRDELVDLLWRKVVARLATHGRLKRCRARLVAPKNTFAASASAATVAVRCGIWSRCGCSTLPVCSRRHT
jgi:hypothetical protein